MSVLQRQSCSLPSPLLSFSALFICLSCFPGVQAHLDAVVDAVKEAKSVVETVANVLKPLNVIEPVIDIASTILSYIK